MRIAELHGRSRGRRAAAVLLVVTIAATAVSAYMGRGYLVDSWWIWQLDSEDKVIRNRAAERLAERKCLRAVPEILEKIEEDTLEGIRTVRSVTSVFTPKPKRDTGGESIATTEEYRTATPLVLVLWNMGDEALPAIDETARASRARLQDLRDRGEVADGGRLLIVLDALLDRGKRMEPWRP